MLRKVSRGGGVCCVFSYIYSTCMHAAGDCGGVCCVPIEGKLSTAPPPCGCQLTQLTEMR